MEGLEAFAIEGGWKRIGEDGMIPVNLKGIESWGRWLAQQKIGIMRDIDYAWGQYGLYNYVPAPYHYWAVGAVTTLPFMLVCSLLCCIVEDDDEPKP
jgi:hypothetical protein